MLNKKLKTLLAIGLVSSAAAFGPIASAQAPRENPQSAASHHGIRYVKAEAVNVRGGLGVSNPIITVLNLGAEVSMYVTKGDWARISGPGQPEKWIYAPLLQDNKLQPVKAAKKQTADRPTQKASAKPDSHQTHEPEASPSKKVEHPTAQKEKQDARPAR